MKIITQNLHCFAEENYLEKFERLAAFIVENDVDVICLQEVAQPRESAFINEDMHLREGNAAQLIAQMIHAISGRAYAVYYSFAHYYYDKEEEGVAILTRLPVVAWKEHIISDEKIDYTIHRRTAIEIHLENNLSINSAHLGIATGEVKVSPALAQFQCLSQAVAGDTQFFFGDYNIPDTTDEYQHIVRNGYVDLFGEGAYQNPKFVTTPEVLDGWRNEKKAKRIDYGFSNCKIDVKEARVIFNGHDDAPISDHYGLYFDVEL